MGSGHGPVKKSFQKSIYIILQGLKKASFQQIKNCVKNSDNPVITQKIRGALGFMVSKGDVKINDSGVYIPLCLRQRNNIQQDKIWRAMRFSASFSIKDIVLLSEASRGYIQKYAYFLIANGYLIKKGKKGGKNIFWITTKATVKTPCFARPDTGSIHKNQKGGKRT